jgi:hypothetical protein
MPETGEVFQIKEQHKAQIMEKPNVVGVGIGYRTVGRRETDELSVVALVRQKVPTAGLTAEELLPRQVNGVPVDVIQVGTLRAQQSPTERVRPAPGGVSIGHYQITAGTLGCVVRDRQTGGRLILSNNHVLANSNNASIGDAILQPGPYDGGTVNQDQIATLERFVPIQFGESPSTCGTANAVAGVLNWLARLMGSSHRLEVRRYLPQATNQVDAALARPLNDADVLDEILEIGAVTGTAPAALGMAVRKSGRTTGFTTGQITVIDATVNVTYGAGQIATFENQLVAGPMSQGGDSGSLVVSGAAPLAVGLLFAGSDQSTIFSPIDLVLNALSVEIGAAAAPAGVGRFTGGTASANPAQSGSGVGAAGGASQQATEKAQAVRQAYEQELLAKPNVVGVGVGIAERRGQPTGEVGLVVMVEKKVPREQLAPQDIIPPEIEGVPVDVQEVGRIRAF